MTSCRQQALKHSLPFPQPLAPQEASWSEGSISCPVTLLHIGRYQGLSFIWNILPLPQPAIFLSVRGTETILSYDVPSLENLLPSLCSLLLCTACSLRRTLHCGEAWPPPTLLLPLVCLTLLVRLWGKNLRRLQRTTWNNDTEWWEGMLASFLWGKVYLN